VISTVFLQIALNLSLTFSKYFHIFRCNFSRRKYVYFLELLFCIKKLFFSIFFLNKSNVIGFVTFFKSITLPITLKRGQLHYQVQLVM